MDDYYIQEEKLSIFDIDPTIKGVFEAFNIENLYHKKQTCTYDYDDFSPKRKKGTYEFTSLEAIKENDGMRRRR